MKKKNFVAIPIKGSEWHFFLESTTVYKRKHGTDSEAIMYPKEKEVYFNASMFDTSNVKHELFHVYVAESHVISSSDFTKDDMEEIGAEIVGEFNELISYQANVIHNKLLALSRKGN